MDENPGNYDKKDPKIAEKLKFLKDLDARTAEKLTCWQDMYDHLKGLAHSYMAEPSKTNADFAMLCFLSFIVAMEILPEEGDIVQIGKKLNEVMVMRPDLTGANLFIGKEADEEVAKHERVKEAMYALVAGLGQPEEENEETGKRMLH